MLVINTCHGTLNMLFETEMFAKFSKKIDFNLVIAKKLKTFVRFQFISDLENYSCDHLCLYLYFLNILLFAKSSNASTYAYVVLKYICVALSADKLSKKGSWAIKVLFDSKAGNKTLYFNKIKLNIDFFKFNSLDNQVEGCSYNNKIMRVCFYFILFRFYVYFTT